MYLVVNDGTIVRKFQDEEEALAYAEEQQEKSEEETANTYDINRDERPEAVAYMNGYDGGLYDVCKVDEKELKEDEEVTVESIDGMSEYEFSTNDILSDDGYEDDYENDYEEDDEDYYSDEDDNEEYIDDDENIEYTLDD